mmetsp:Transcript_41234/g.80699  ORF Transcript_41234/g.80699 Transcript_41234/m.80699 type:complete len:256 (-) Transcript_41234:176-943(-)
MARTMTGGAAKTHPPPSWRCRRTPRRSVSLSLTPTGTPAPTARTVARSAGRFPTGWTATPSWPSTGAGTASFPRGTRWCEYPWATTGCRLPISRSTFFAIAVPAPSGRRGCGLSTSSSTGATGYSSAVTGREILGGTASSWSGTARPQTIGTAGPRTPQMTESWRMRVVWTGMGSAAFQTERRLSDWLWQFRLRLWRSWVLSCTTGKRGRVLIQMLRCRLNRRRRRKLMEHRRQIELRRVLPHRFPLRPQTQPFN